jgi:hypothetical protein
LLEGLDERTRVAAENGTAIQYARQTRTGSAPESKGAVSWMMRWRAPEDPVAPVVFHAAANAANYDDSPLGDFPYTLEAMSRPADSPAMDRRRLNVKEKQGPSIWTVPVFLSVQSAAKSVSPDLQPGLVWRPVPYRRRQSRQP